MVFVSLAILITVSIFQYRIEAVSSGKIEDSRLTGITCVRDIIAKRNIVIRWIIILGLLFYVILVAEYGPGYSAAEFIYKDF